MTINEETKIIITSENNEVEFDFKNGTADDYLTLLWQGVRSVSLQEGLEPSDVLSRMFHAEVQCKHLG